MQQLEANLWERFHGLNFLFEANLSDDELRITVSNSSITKSTLGCNLIILKQETLLAGKNFTSNGKIVPVNIKKEVITTIKMVKTNEHLNIIM